MGFAVGCDVHDPCPLQLQFPPVHPIVPEHPVSVIPFATTV